MSEILIALGAFAAGVVVGALVQRTAMSKLRRESEEASRQVNKLVNELERAAREAYSLADKLDWLRDAAGNIRASFDDLKRNLDTIKELVEEAKDSCRDLDSDVRNLIDLMERKIRWTVKVSVAPKGEGREER